MNVWIVTYGTGYDKKMIAAASTEAKANEAIDAHQEENPELRFSYTIQAIEVDKWERF
jgi:hypothetical protein